MTRDTQDIDLQRVVWTVSSQGPTARSSIRTGNVSMNRPTVPGGKRPRLMTPGPVDIPKAVSLLRVLADPARLRIALRLLDGEQAVKQLGTELALRQLNLSQYLGELREAGLVAKRR